jgi:phosphoglycerate kinase
MRLPRSVRDADVAGKHVLVRVDFNVPLEDGHVADDTRIRASLPTLRLLLDRGAAEVALCSHLGRPEGEDPAYRMAPVAERLGELLPDDRLRVLENTRFDPGEVANDPSYARELASGRDLYVNDAFGSAHRAHASTEGVAHLLPAYAGLLLERELRELSRLVETPERPFVAIVGGAKVADKIGVLRRLAQLADALLIGGKMAAELASHAPLEGRADVLLPTDVVAAAAFEPDAEARVVAEDAVPAGWLALDIGPDTRFRFADRIGAAGTVFWNGPMGVFEWPRFAEGTRAVAVAVAGAAGFTVVGGGDSVRAVEELGIADRIDWISTGGGASLELLEGRELPGVVAIPPA